MKKLFSILILAVLLCLPFWSMAFANKLDEPDFQLSYDGFVYKELSFEQNGQQKMFYGEYNSTTQDAKYQWVIHSVRSGSQTTLSTVMQIAEDYQQTTGQKVIFAANGDYFDFGSGANMESYVNNGIVISKGSYITKHCIGFDNNGKVAVGRMTEVQTRLLVESNGVRHLFEIDKFNQQSEQGIALFTTVGTHTVSNAGVVISKTDSVNLTMYPVWGTDYTMWTKGVQQQRQFSLTSGRFAVVYPQAYAEIFDNIAYGDQVSIVEIPAGDFENCTWVLGGYDILVNDYTVNTNCHTDNSGNVAAPRTMIGFKEDGTAFLCMLDGRQSGYAIGVTVNQQAQIASQLGARFALELDGGGSTTVLVRIDDVLTLRNQPSDGAMRKVSNAILLVEAAQQEEQPGDGDNPDPSPTPTPTPTPNPTPTPTPDDNQQTPSINTDIIIVLAVCVAVVVGSVVTFIVLMRKKGG